MTRSVNVCVICGSRDITIDWADERNATTTCSGCRRVVNIEFDPPHDPGIRALIELVYDPDDDDSGGNVAPRVIPRRVRKRA